MNHISTSPSGRCKVVLGSGTLDPGLMVPAVTLSLGKGVAPHLRVNGPMNINHYATKKSVAESMLDVALFMANVTQLKAVLEQGTSFQYYAALVVLISISLFFQVLIGILLIITARLNLNDIAKQPRLNILNNAATALIFVTVILNIFITAFGVQKTGLYPTRNFGPY
ncbi:hypothetical protein HGM15179_004255 [Zosterops borbonicus]|uniref:Ninjurin 2 n=1 Tax=Zosterops borbonicus TaxID=364589 RepID=A0A8K1LQY0_9PASS|nr:hypothetical protein HGM15179_004255 [Zosterops borbonicus]